LPFTRLNRAGLFILEEERSIAPLSGIANEQLSLHFSMIIIGLPDQLHISHQFVTFFLLIHSFLEKHYCGMQNGLVFDE